MKQGLSSKIFTKTCVMDAVWRKEISLVYFLYQPYFLLTTAFCSERPANHCAQKSFFLLLKTLLSLYSRSGNLHRCVLSQSTVAFLNDSALCPLLWNSCSLLPGVHSVPPYITTNAHFVPCSRNICLNLFTKVSHLSSGPKVGLPFSRKFLSSKKLKKTKEDWIGKKLAL